MSFRCWPARGTKWLNHISPLVGPNLTNKKVIRMPFQSFERFCLPHKLKAPALDVTLFLRNLTHLPYDPLKLALDRHLTQGVLCLDLNQESQWVARHLLWGETLKSMVLLHLFICVRFADQTQNPSVPDLCFEEFTISSLKDFINKDRGELLLFPVRVLKYYLSEIEQYHPSVITISSLQDVQRRRLK